MAFQQANFQLDPPNPIKTLDISPNGNFLAIAQWGRTGDYYNCHLSLWHLPEIQKQPQIEIFQAERKLIESARFTYNNNLAYITNFSDIIFYYSQSKKNFLTPSRPNSTRVIWLSCASNSPRIVTSGLILSVWDLDKLEPIWYCQEYMAFLQKNPAIADITPDGKTIAIAGNNTDRILIFDLDRQKIIKTLPDAPLQARWAKYSPDLNYFAVLGIATRSIHIWNYQNNLKHLPQLFDTAGDGFWCCLCFHPNSKYLAAGTLGGKIYIFRIINGEIIFNCKAHQGRVWDLAFTPDGKQLISGSSDGSLSIVKLALI